MQQEKKLCKILNRETGKVVIVPQSTLDLMNKNTKLAQKIEFICYTNSFQNNENTSTVREAKETRKPISKIEIIGDSDKFDESGNNGNTTGLEELEQQVEQYDSGGDCKCNTGTEITEKICCSDKPKRGRKAKTEF